MKTVERRLAALFIIGIFALYPPLLVAFNRAAIFLGLPVLPFYLFTAWGVLIGICCIISRGAES